jgi:hypothetical protein
MIGLITSEVSLEYTFDGLTRVFNIDYDEPDYC